MGGILGIVAPPGAEVRLDQRQLLSMRDSMLARGPDEAGLFAHHNVAFAHRRLSIRDIAGGSQPWLSEDRQCVLVYNGEVYNDGPLREELIALGHHFRSRCDTEVVMAAYRQWGTDCLQRLRGMFALGIYDFRHERLFLARDRFGIKPLFVADVDDTLVFASSLRAIAAHPRFVKRPNWSALSHYLTTFHTTLGRETVFSGIHQLLPGEMLCCERGTARIERYWNYPTDEQTAMEYEEAVDLLQTQLRDAVACRLVSDVPVGMFLSGGVDSNTIASFIREATPERMIGQCGGGESDEGGDFAHARRCADHVGFEFGEVRVPPAEYFDCWKWMLAENMTPLSTPTDVILYRLAAEMKKSVGVVLGGEGADELLCGYAVFHWAGEDYNRASQLAAGKWPGLSKTAQLLRDSLIEQYGRDRFASPTDHYFALNSLIPTAAKPALFQPWVWQEAEEDRPMWTEYSALFDEQAERDTLQRQTTILHRVNLEGLLGRLDSATMLAGLEARVPYTDHFLVERMFRVPRRYKIDTAHDLQAPYLASAALERRGSLRSKRILRTLAERRLPTELAQRKKASFPTPIAKWLSDDWQVWVRQQLQTSPFAGEVFQPHAMHELAENLPQAGMWLWPLMNVITWGDQQFAA